MIIKQTEDGNKGMFYVKENEEVVAEMTYRKEGNNLVIDHTEVDESLRGKNVGYQLVNRGVEYARESNLKIVPLCAFAKSVIEKTPEFQDVL
ncbi:MAG TPA: GNAT family N-acetyltransferase [Segetibacter sp.]